MQAENDARRAKAAADQAAAAAAEASRSLKLGEKQNVGKGRDGEVSGAEIISTVRGGMRKESGERGRVCVQDARGSLWRVKNGRI